MQPINPFERAIIDHAREMATQELKKRVPAIPQIDHRRLIYCLIEDRIADYKLAGKKNALEQSLFDFAISKKAYYTWYEKYHSYYKQCKNS